MSTGERAGRRLAAATAVVSVSMAASRVLGFLRNSVISAAFCQNRLTDMLNTSFVVPDTIYLILVGGGVSSAFIPVLSRYMAQQDEDEVWRMVSTALNFVSMFSGAEDTSGFQDTADGRRKYKPHVVQSHGYKPRLGITIARDKLPGRLLVGCCSLNISFPRGRGFFYLQQAGEFHRLLLQEGHYMGVGVKRNRDCGMAKPLLDYLPARRSIVA